MKRIAALLPGGGRAVYRSDVTWVKRGDMARLLTDPARPSPALQAAIDERRAQRGKTA